MIDLIMNVYIEIIHIIITTDSGMKILSSQLIKLINRFSQRKTHDIEFRSTAFLSHSFLQLIYNLAEPTLPIQMQRDKIFFDDGGHVTLDWGPRIKGSAKPPILFIMHGLTGGSQMNYIRVLMCEAYQQNFQSVCLNSRGINSTMTSPIPFAAISHHQLATALSKVQMDYPGSDIYLLGTSFGGNYLIRYLLNEKRPSIKGLVALAPPLNVKKVVDDMPVIYQKFFVKMYIDWNVTKHPEMEYWERIGLVDLNAVKKAANLREFHDELTIKILGFKDTDELFSHYHISEEQISRLDVDTFFMISKDDPIVSYRSIPVETIQQNKKIRFMATQRGGHLCWFTGILPKRWYPKPTFEYLKELRKRKSSEIGRVSPT